MKKIIAILLAAAMLVALFCACGKNDAPVNSAEPEADAIDPPVNSAEPEEAPVDERSAADIWAVVQESIDMNNMPGFTELDAETFNGFYGLDDSALESYVCQFPTMIVHATEIFIGKCVEGEEATVMGGIERRQQALVDTWSNYLPDQFALVEDARIVRNGQWVLFCVSEQADAIEEAFNAATK